MSAKTPIRATFTGSDVTGLAEYQSGEFIDLTHGGLGASLSIGTTGQVLKVNSDGTALEFGNVEAVINIDTANDLTGSTLVSSDQILLSDGGIEGRVTLSQLDILFSGTTQTLTNKTLTSPVIDTITNVGTLTLPTSTDTLVGRATADTLTNKSISLTNNTVTGTLAEFNTAVSDATLVSTTGIETLTNKTLTSPVIATISNTGTITLPSSTDTLVGRNTTDTLTNKTIDTANNTITVVEADISDLQSYILTDSTDTLQNKTINLSDNTLTGTTSQFNSALSDGSFATLAGTETLTNKTLTSPVIANITSTADIDLTATNDVNIPANVGLTFGGDGEKIEGDGTNLVIQSSGYMEVKSAGNLLLDSTGGSIFLRDTTLNLLQVLKSGSADTIIKQPLSDGDLLIKGNDGGSEITALSFDMSEAGNAIFNNNVTVGNDLVVTGNLTVSGSTTTINTETINLADNTIVLNSNATGSATENGGIEIERGDDPNKTLLWNETSDKWTVGSETFVAGIFEGALTGDVTGNAATATALETARTIAGQSFDGTANITIASTDLSNSSNITLNDASQILTNKTLTSPTISTILNTGTLTLPTSTGTIALTSDIPTNNNVLTNGAGYITASSTDILTNKSGNISQWTNDAGYLTTETNDLSSAVTWANVPDGNITQSSVTQHQSALTITESQISDLQSYLTTEADTLATVTGRGATTTTTAVIPFYYANQAAFPNATTYHGAIAHSHSDGAMYFAHGGSWNKMANDSQLTNSTNWDTAYSWGDHSTQDYLTSTNINTSTSGSNALITLTNSAGVSDSVTLAAGSNITISESGDTITIASTASGSALTIQDEGSTLTTDATTLNFVGAGVTASGTGSTKTITISGSGGSSYTDLDVDTHLNTGSASSGEVLSWNGSDYAWVSGSSTVIAPFAFANVETTSNGSATGISWSNWNSANSTLDFTFDNAQANTQYTVVTDSETFDDYSVGISNKTTTGFTAEFYDSSGSRTPSNFSPFTIIVYGETPTQTVLGSGSLTDLSVTTNSTGTAALTYANGVFTFTPPDLSGYQLTSNAFDGDYNSLSNTPTIPSALTDLGITDGTADQVLKTDGAGNFTFGTITTGSSYGDSDVNTHLNTGSASSGEVLSWNGSDFDWVAQSGGGSSLTVSEIDGSNNITNLVSNVDTIRFDKDTGFNVTDLGSGEIKVSLGSSFKTLQVNGQNDLVATGEDTLEIEAGTGISITTDINSDPKKLRISATGSGSVTAIENGSYALSMQSDGVLTLPNTAFIFDSTATFSTTTSGQTLDSFSATDYRSAKYIIQAFSGEDVHVTELLLTHNDTTVYTSESNTTYSSSSLITLGASISSGNVVVTVTPANANADTTVDFYRTTLLARTLEFSFEGDLQSLSGTDVDLQSDTGSEDLAA